MPAQFHVSAGMQRHAFLLALLAIPCWTACADPPYEIYNIGVVQPGDYASEALGVSTASIVVGRSLRDSASQAFMWTRSGIRGLPNLPGFAYCAATSARNYGETAAVGTCSTSATGENRVPVSWQNGVATQLAVPSGATLPEVNAISPLGTAVGSARSGSLQRAVIYRNGGAAFITQVTSTGSYFANAFGISEFERTVGKGVDPSNPGRNVGLLYRYDSGEITEVAALAGRNGAIVYGIANYGQFFAGASMLDQGPPLPVRWSENGSMVAIPLVPGTTQGSARGVNSAGWTVGTDSAQFPIPFLYDGTTTYRLADLLPNGSGWDLVMNTASSAVAINDGRAIVGTGVYNGQTRAYAMLPPLPPLLCTVCHKFSTTLTYQCDSAEYRRHRDHGDPQGPCPLGATPQLGEPQ